MAEQLKRDYDIVVLKVELLDTRPNVRFTLQAKIDGVLTDVGLWKSDTSDMGLSTRERGQRATYQDVTGNLPHDLIAFLEDWIGANTSGDRPLWVHLVKPYGVLRFVDHEERWVHQAMRDVSHRILDASARRTRLHIFADSAVAPALSDQYKSEGRLDVDVFVYGHEKAVPYLEADPSSRLVDQTGQLRSPWLLWMRDALRGRSIDVMHFVCHGYLTRDRGALLFAQSPMERTDRYLAGPVGQTELATFLTQLGAWSTAFTSVWDDNSEPGLRALADDIAQSRPGPLLMHTVRHDPPAGAVTDAYRFLYGIEPMDAPKSSSLFMYCQPYRVRTKDAAAELGRLRRVGDHTGVRNAQQQDAVERVAFESSPLDPIFEKEETVLPWVASTERFAEQVQLRLQQSARDQDEAEPDDSRELRHQVTLDTLDKLRAAVARMASAESAGSASDEGQETAGTGGAA